MTTHCKHKTIYKGHCIDCGRIVKAGSWPFDFDHQLRIAHDTLKMSDAGAKIMGGMTKDEARRIIEDKRR